MKPTFVTMSIMALCLTLLTGCDKPEAEPTGGDTQTGSGAENTVPITIEVEDPNQSDALTAAAAVAPAKTKAGETVTFAVRAKTADSWHIYSFDHAGVGSPTTIELELPEGVELEGEWVAPEAKAYPSVQPSFVFEGDMMFQHTLKIADDAAPGPREVKCKFAYQTCNESFCNPPTSMALSATIEVE